MLTEALEQVVKFDKESEYSYTFKDLKLIATSIQELRETILFGFESAGMDSIAEMHYLKSLNSLEQAVFNCQLANIYQMRAMNDK